MAAPKNPNREAAARGGRKSSRKGAPNKRTVALLDRLDELGCDPLELSAKIALGYELDGPHPSYKAFKKIAEDIQALAGTGEPVPEDLADKLLLLVEDQLTKGYVPIELRSKHIADLMQYSYPKRKAVEVDANLNVKPVPKVDPAKLSNDALDQLLAARTGQAVGAVIDGEVAEDD
jgi:hypothetical protein